MGHLALLQILNSAAAAWKQPQTNVHEWARLCSIKFYLQKQPYFDNSCPTAWRCWKSFCHCKGKVCLGIEPLEKGKKPKKLREGWLRWDRFHYIIWAPGSSPAWNYLNTGDFLYMNQYILSLFFLLKPKGVGFSLTCNQKGSNKFTGWP